MLSLAATLRTVDNCSLSGVFFKQCPGMGLTEFLSVPCDLVLCKHL